MKKEKKTIKNKSPKQTSISERKDDNDWVHDKGKQKQTSREEVISIYTLRVGESSLTVKGKNSNFYD
jgi:hypothetical protein